jgi:hypothetical protein
MINMKNKLMVLILAIVFVLLSVSVISAEVIENNESSDGKEAPTEDSPGEPANTQESESTTETAEPERNQTGTPNGSAECLFDQNPNHWRYKYRKEIQQGICNETVVMECNLSKKEGKMYIYSYEYQNGMKVEVKTQNKNQLEIKVSGEFKEGKVLVMNIEGSAFQLKHSNELKVKFDGKEIKEASVDEVMDGVGYNAQYTTAIGEDGGQFMFYIPHFSEHMITIETAAESGAASTNFILGAVGAGLLTVLILVIIIVKIKKMD